MENGKWKMENWTNKNSTKPFYKCEIPTDWKISTFGSVFSFLKSFSFSRENLTDEKTVDGIQYIHYGDIHARFENEILDFEIEKRIPYLKDGFIKKDDLEDEEFPLLKDGDLIITDVSEDYEGIGECVELKNVNGRKIISGLHTFAMRDENDKTSLGFRTYILKHQQVIRELRRIATGISVYGISKTNISKVKLPLPPLPEQKKIAAILSTWDSAIETCEKLISAKQTRKRALAQRLLTGKQRFPQFAGQAWENMRVGNIAKEISLKNKNDEQITVLSCTKHQGLIDSLSYFGKRIFSKDLSKYKVVKRGQFAYATNHIEEGSIGYQDLYDKALISPMYTVFETNNKVDDGFLYKLLKTETYRHIFEAMTSGSINRRGSLRWNGFKLIKIKLPSIEEQKRIAEVLSACDKEIELLENKRDALKQQKRGLMQKLLTGKVRVKVEEENGE